MINTTKNADKLYQMLVKRLKTEQASVYLGFTDKMKIKIVT